MHPILLGCQLVRCRELSPASMRQTPFLWKGSGLFTFATLKHFCNSQSFDSELTDSPNFETLAVVSCFFRKFTPLSKVNREREGRSIESFFFLLWVCWVKQCGRVKLKLPFPCELVIPITTRNSFFKLRSTEENTQEEETSYVFFPHWFCLCFSLFQYVHLGFLSSSVMYILTSFLVENWVALIHLSFASLHFHYYVEF